MQIGNKTIGERKPRGFQKGNKLGTLNKGRPRTKEWLENQRKSKLGKHYSPKTEFKKGQIGRKGIPNPKAKNLPQAFKKGQRPHNWKGGISPFRMKIRTSIEYRRWRSDVFRRDDFTCVLCFKRGGLLNADHFPKLFSEILNKNEITDMPTALVCDELWDINNGRTLCKQCHYKITWEI